MAGGVVAGQTVSLGLDAITRMIRHVDVIRHL